MGRLIRLLLPFFLIAIILCAFVLGMIVLSYLFIVGAVAALALMVITWIRKTFFPPKIRVKPTQKQSGRIIDSDEWNQL